jgi:hypothetical protein
LLGLGHQTLLPKAQARAFYLSQSLLDVKIYTAVFKLKLGATYPYCDGATSDA